MCVRASGENPGSQRSAIVVLYYVVVATLMFALPVLSVAIEATHSSIRVDSLLIGKWFVFWSVGWRLLLAGVRQIAQPEYTAREILGLQSAESWTVVRELGFGNVALGVVGVVSLWLPAWQLAAALAGGLFYILAGINHARQQHRNRLENVAMVSDLFVGLILLGVCVAAGVTA
jgi:hypothetical protein